MAYRFVANLLVAFALTLSAIERASPGEQRIAAGYSIYSALTAPLWVTKEAGHFEKTDSAST